MIRAPGNAGNADDRRNAVGSWAFDNHHRRVASWGSCGYGRFERRLRQLSGWAINDDCVVQAVQLHRLLRCAPV